MPNRTTTLASTVFATALAGAGLMCAGGAPAGAADDCLHGPNHEATDGGHWYYRVDRRNHRKCWYLADEGRKTAVVRSAKPAPSAANNSERSAERMRQSNADARAELLAPRSEEQPGEPNVSAKPVVEPVADAPLRSASEEPVSPAGNPSLNPTPPANSAPPAQSETSATTAVEDALMEAEADALPAAAASEQGAAVQPPPVDETAISPFRLILSLLLMAMGFAAVMAGVVFKRSDSAPARRNHVPLPMPDAAGEPEEASEERASLAFIHDVPLFLVPGRTGPDRRAVTDQNYGDTALH